MLFRVGSEAVVMFEFLAIKIARLTKATAGKEDHTAVQCTHGRLSSILDNVTTVLLIGPASADHVRLLDINPIPFFAAGYRVEHPGTTSAHQRS